MSGNTLFSQLKRSLVLATALAGMALASGCTVHVEPDHPHYYHHYDQVWVPGHWRHGYYGDEWVPGHWE